MVWHLVDCGLANFLVALSVASHFFSSLRRRSAQIGRPRLAKTSVGDSLPLRRAWHQKIDRALHIAFPPPPSLQPRPIFAMSLNAGSRSR
jgi:hypothetical protein